MDALTLLRELSEAVGVSGAEDEVRTILRHRVGPFVEGVAVDALGNLLAWRGDPQAPAVVVAAHTDEVGFLVSAIEPGGFLRIAALGRTDARVTMGQEVVVVTKSGERYWGTVGCPSPHLTEEAQRNAVVPLESQFVDIGARSDQAAAGWGIRVGDPAVLWSAFRELPGRVVMGKALDDRAGCALLVLALERLASVDLGIRLVAAFTAQEEVGLRGATVVGNRVKPKVALALEGTAAGDFPGMEPHRVPVAMGKGVALTVGDHRLLAHRGLLAFLEEVAEAHGIPVQRKRPLFGGTDAGALALAGEGAMAGVISIPCRYIHTPRALMSLDDFEAGVTLLVQALRQMGDWLASRGTEAQAGP